MMDRLSTQGIGLRPSVLGYVLPVRWAGGRTIGLIRIATYLLARQIRHLEGAFLQEGGLRERMTRARIKERGEVG